MNFSLDEAIQILEATPKTLDSFLSNLSDGWLTCNEGDGTWNSSQVIDHLIECENNNWIPRIKTILKESDNKSFPPFDRDAHITNPPKTSIDQKLMEFKRLRLQNIEIVKELISTWVVHDLTHISQIVRVMSKRYRKDVGPWEGYLGVLK